MTPGQQTDPDLQSSTGTPKPDAAIGYARQAAFYDKHLAPDLILEHVVYLDTLVSAMEATVDQAIQDAINRNFLPKSEHAADALHTRRQIECFDKYSDWTPCRESGVADLYSCYAAKYCCSIASTLAIHPSSDNWHSALIWSPEVKETRWAIADGALRISTEVNEDGHLIRQLLQNESAPDDTKRIIEKLASHRTALAIWEMKNLTVGTAQVMQEVAEMGIVPSKFQWKKCTPPSPCDHRRLEAMQQSRGTYEAGHDPLSPPWMQPIVPSTSTAAVVQSTPLREGLGSASGGTTSILSYKEPSSEDGEVVGGKRRRNDSDALEYGRPPPKKLKADLTEESYEPPPGAREEVSAQSFLQQVP